MKTLAFSNGLMIDSTLIVSIESNRQTIQFPGAAGELEHLIRGRPSGILIRLNDGSTVEIKAGQSRLSIQLNELPAATTIE